MLISEINIPVTNLPGVGTAAAAQLKKLGVENIGELLRLFPRDWEDRTKIHSFSDWNKVQKINVPVKVTAHEWFGFGSMKTLKITVVDDFGESAGLICFNRPFMEKNFPINTKGIVYGCFYRKYGELQATSFELEKTENFSAKIMPIYPLTLGLGQGKLRKIILNALKLYAHGIDSELPEKILQIYNLPSKQQVLFLLHTPENGADIERGKYALIFEELFLFQYAIGKHSLERRGKLPNIEDENTPLEHLKKNPIITPLQEQFLNRLSFQLTEDQLTVIAEINSDLDTAENTAQINSMARLVQGDVGSGKTLIAFLACLKIIEKGGQTAFLAPTELLARQHAENAALLLEPLGVRLAFLTGNVKVKGRTNLLRELERGNIDLIIGTHSLFSAGVNYKNLRLVVIDEQHRFGVLQRSAIIQKGIESSDLQLKLKNNEITKIQAPHILMMSATPIPRTLALSVFGDLDISTIHTMPSGRKPVITYIAGQDKAERVYTFIGEEILKGRQAYFIYPLIEDNDDLSLKSAERMFEELKLGFPDHKIALLHSKIADEEQRSIMQEFKAGTINILVATSVVEVGVDVPNATCMVIEHAERFGLSALHQMRGRVGRGNAQSYCFLIYGKKLTENAYKRLKIMKESCDGFYIAEEDLKLRGPGDIRGIEQSGYLCFKFADPITDYKILQEARRAAFDILQQ